MESVTDHKTLHPRAFGFTPVRKAVVLGAGIMGSQIAAHLANAGVSVMLLDIVSSSGSPNAIVNAGLKRMEKLNPAPLMSKAARARIRTGNLRDNLGELTDVDWVIEAVVERLDVKRELMERVESQTSDRTIVSTNTSGLPIAQITEGRSIDFKRRFLGTHFFNPPRYLKLLEIIPGEETSFEVLERIASFGYSRLGKGIVLAKDTPNFIGNRIGTYAMMASARMLLRGYTIEEIDELTGTLVGRPKSGTFRTADIVGLDTLIHVTENLYQNVSSDESREMFVVPEFLKRLVAEGRLGSKSGAGFYRKVDGEILSVDPETLDYSVAEPFDLPDLDTIKSVRGSQERSRLLFESEGRAGNFFRKTMLDIMHYAARRIPEISDSPADVDRAMKWGFGWETGPFELWDYIGFKKVQTSMEAAGMTVPGWILNMESGGFNSFYQHIDGAKSSFVFGVGNTPLWSPPDNISLNTVSKFEANRIWKNDDATLWHIGEGVALFEFNSKANSLGASVMQGLNECLDIVEEGDFRGLVIGNEGKNFSVGANLAEMVMAMMMGQFDAIDEMIARFQTIVQRIKYAGKPVVVSPHQRTLGGGCEMTMASQHPVLSAETYIGLVELGVGLIPAGSGTMRMTAWAAERATSDFPSDIQQVLRRYFETIAMAKVALGGFEAIELGYVAPGTTVVMNDDRRLYVAREEVVRLSNEGYAPPPTGENVRVLGKPARALFEAALHQFAEGRFISEYDKHIARKLAYIMTGGDVSGPTDVTEKYLLDLEREAFLSLLGEEKTQARIESILTTNKPLRN